MHARDGRVELKVPAAALRLERRGKGLVAVPEAELPRLTAEDVRAAYDRLGASVAYLGDS